jgi:hypothetical protein
LQARHSIWENSLEPDQRFRSMAKQQKIRYLEDDEFVGFNLNFAIGPGAVNERGDVMLIQALLLLIGGDDPTNISKNQRVRLPALSGYLDAETYAILVLFQFRWMHLVYNSVAAWVDPLPADYWLQHMKDRRPLMAMINELAWTAKGTSSVTLPQLVMQDFPELRPLLKP